MGTLLDTALEVSQTSVVVSVDDQHVDEDEPDGIDDQWIDENDDGQPFAILCKSESTAK